MLRNFNRFATKNFTKGFVIKQSILFAHRNAEDQHPMNKIILTKDFYGI